MAQDVRNYWGRSAKGIPACFLHLVLPGLPWVYNVSVTPFDHHALLTETRTPNTSFFTQAVRYFDDRVAKVTKIKMHMTTHHRKTLLFVYLINIPKP